MERKGFTLIELLVVISIIALLMSIMMPALSKVKEEAIKISCMARLRQWAVPIQMYTSENNGKLSEANSSAISGGKNFGAYQILYRDFWQENPEIVICPKADKELGEGGNINYYLRLNTNVKDDYDVINKDFYHSYGWSNFCYGPYEPQHQRRRDYWGSIEQSNSENIPMYGDELRQAGWAYPETDDPPDYPGEMPTDIWTDQLNQWCIDRHGGKVNYLFMDFTVRTVSLKKLWYLKWHRNAEYQDNIDWPDWMAQLPDGR